MALPDDFPFPSPPAEPGRDREADAAAAWGAIARIFLSQQRHREQVAESLGMSFSELIPLFHLDPAGGISQRDLAELWSCDPSWVTNRVDRLEQLGLAERRVSSSDRRVKEVWLTTEGKRRRTQGMGGFAHPPEGFAALPSDDLAALLRILAKLDPGADPDQAAGRDAPTS